jgi:hypothetical protein
MMNYPTEGQEEIRRIIRKHLVTHQKLWQDMSLIRETQGDGSDLTLARSKLYEFYKNIQFELSNNKKIADDPITGQPIENKSFSNNYISYLTRYSLRENRTIGASETVRVELDRYIYPNPRRAGDGTRISHGGVKYHTTYQCLFALALKEIIHNNPQLEKEVREWYENDRFGESKEFQLTLDIKLQSLQLLKNIGLYDGGWETAYYEKEGICTALDGSHRLLAHVLWGDPLISPSRITWCVESKVDPDLNQALIKIEEFLQEFNFSFSFVDYSDISDDKITKIKNFFGNVTNSEIDVLRKFVGDSERNYPSRYCRGINRDAFDIYALQRIIDKLRRVESRSFIEKIIYRIKKYLGWVKHDYYSFEQWYDLNESSLKA